MPENCDAACVKNIINTRLIAYIAALLAEAAGKSHKLYGPAKVLATASRAACEAYAVAIEEGTLVKTCEHSDWHGCDEASYLIQLVEDVRSGEWKPSDDAEYKLSEWADRAIRITKALVSGSGYAH